MGKNKATKAAKETRRGTDINKKAIFTVKQNYTLGVSIKDHGIPTLGTQVTITGTASGTDGLSTLGSRVLRTLGVAENVKTPGGTTLGEMKLFQPEGMGNPSPSTGTFLAAVKGGTSAGSGRRRGPGGAHVRRSRPSRPLDGKRCRAAGPAAHPPGLVRGSPEACPPLGR